LHLDRTTVGDAWRSVCLWALVALALQGALRTATPFSFETIFLSDGANSFHSVAERYSAESVLADFDRARVDWPLHAQSNMPGKLLVLHAFRTLSKRPDVLPWLIVLASNLGALLMYGVVKELFADRRMAFFAAVLYLFVPAKLFFFPLMNTFTPVVALAAAYIALRWMATWRWSYTMVLGAAAYGLVLYEPLSLAMGGLFAALLIRSVWRGSVTGSRALPQIAGVAVVFLLTHAVMLASFGFDVWQAFQQLAADAADFNAQAGRPYSIWVRENLREFLFGSGIAQVVLFPAALMMALWPRAKEQEPGTPPIVTLSVGLVGVLLAIDLVGFNRGEVIRLWIFLACFFQIPAAYVCAHFRGKGALAAVVGASVMQSALGTSMIGFILPG
jgi:hypothetical protein